MRYAAQIVGERETPARQWMRILISFDLLVKRASWIKALTASKWGVISASGSSSHVMLSTVAGQDGLGPNQGIGPERIETMCVKPTWLTTASLAHEMSER